MVASPKDEVWGLVYEITRKDLKSLDRFEGYPDVYTRFRGRVNTPTGSLSNVWTYSVVQKRNFIPPTQRYLNVIREAAKKFEFPEPYQAVLERVETVKGE